MQKSFLPLALLYFQKTPKRVLGVFERGNTYCSGLGFQFLGLRKRLYCAEKNKAPFGAANITIFKNFQPVVGVFEKGESARGRKNFLQKVLPPLAAYLPDSYSKFNSPTEVTVEGRAGASSSARFWKA